MLLRCMALEMEKSWIRGRIIDPFYNFRLWDELLELCKAIEFALLLLG